MMPYVFVLPIEYSFILLIVLFSNNILFVILNLSPTLNLLGILEDRGGIDSTVKINVLILSLKSSS